MATLVTRTLKASGGDYTLPSAWEAALPADISTATGTDEHHVLECYNDWPSGLDDTVSLAGHTSDATGYMEIKTPISERHDGNPDTGFHLKNTIYNVTGLSLAAYARIEGLGVRMTNGQTYCYRTGYRDVIVESCIAAGAVHGGFNIGFSYTASGNRPIHRNCLAIDISATGNYGGFGGDTWREFELDNCVAINCGNQGIYAVSGGPYVVKNCVCYGNTVNFRGSTYHSTSTNNAASDGSTVTPPGTNPLTVDIVASDFIDAANDDYHLSPDSQLIGQGADLSATFTDDVDGDTRDTPWDIGFDTRGSIRFGKVTVESGGTTTTVALDFSAAVLGQTLIAVIGKDDDVATTGQPGGWTLVQGFESNNNIYIEVWKKEATGSETATETWTGDSEEYVAAGYLIDNADYSTVNVGVATSVGTDAAPVSPTVTPLTDAALVLAGFVVDGDSTPVSVDSGLRDSVSLQSTTGAGSVGMAIGYLRQATAAATGTFTHSLNSADEWAGFTIWIEKAAGAAGAALAGDAVGQATAAAEATTGIPIAGAMLSVATSSGVISTGIDLGAAASAISLLDGNIDTEIRVSVAAIIEALAQAGLDTQTLFEAAAAGQADAGGTLQSDAAELAGDAAGVAQGSADLSTSGALLAAVANAIADGNATITIAITMQGDALAEALAQAGLTVGGSGLEGDASAVADALAVMLAQINMIGGGSAVVTMLGGIDTILQMQAAAASASNMLGGLNTSITVEAAAFINALAQAGLTTAGGGLEGDAGAVADSTGWLKIKVQFDGDAVGEAVAAGNLTTGALDIPTIPRWTATAGKRNWTVEDKRSWEVCA